MGSGARPRPGAEACALVGQHKLRHEVGCCDADGKGVPDRRIGLKVSAGTPLQQGWGWGCWVPNPPRHSTPNQTLGVLAFQSQSNARTSLTSSKHQVNGLSGRKADVRLGSAKHGAFLGIRVWPWHGWAGCAGRSHAHPHAHAPGESSAGASSCRTCAFFTPILLYRVAFVLTCTDANPGLHGPCAMTVHCFALPWGVSPFSNALPGKNGARSCKSHYKSARHAATLGLAIAELSAAWPGDLKCAGRGVELAGNWQDMPERAGHADMRACNRTPFPPSPPVSNRGELGVGQAMLRLRPHALPRFGQGKSVERHARRSHGTASWWPGHPDRLATDLLLLSNIAAFGVQLLTRHKFTAWGAKACVGWGEGVLARFLSALDCHGG